MTFNKKLKKMKLKKSKSIWHICFFNYTQSIIIDNRHTFRRKIHARNPTPVSFIPIFNHSLQLPLSKPCRLIVTRS